MLFGIEVHSYEQKAVNFPGWFAFVREPTLLAFQTAPGDLRGP